MKNNKIKKEAWEIINKFRVINEIKLNKIKKEKKST